MFCLRVFARTSKNSMFILYLSQTARHLALSGITRNKDHICKQPQNPFVENNTRNEVWLI